MNGNGIDGGMAAYKVLSVGRPWVLGIQNQVVSYCGVGLCDPILQNSVSAMEPFRYASCLFTWTNIGTTGGLAPIAANSDGGNLSLATGTEIDLFQAGVGDPMPGNGWWIQTISDTDLFRSGAPVDRGFMFLVTGVTFEALDCFQRGGTGTSATDPKFYSNWLHESNNGPGYSFNIQKFHMNYTAMQFTFGDTGCSYRIGVGAFWPHWGGPAGSQTVRNGLICTPGMYLPFTTSVCIGARDDVKQLTLTLTSGQGGVIQSVPALPTIAGSLAATNGTINTANNGDVHCTVRVMTIGYIVCVPYADYCGIPTLTPDEVQLFRARLGLQPTQGATQPTYAPGAVQTVGPNMIGTPQVTPP